MVVPSNQQLLILKSAFAELGLRHGSGSSGALLYNAPAWLLPLGRNGEGRSRTLRVRRQGALPALLCRLLSLTTHLTTRNSCCIKTFDYSCSNLNLDLNRRIEYWTSPVSRAAASMVATLTHTRVATAVHERRRGAPGSLRGQTVARAGGGGRSLYRIYTKHSCKAHYTDLDCNATCRKSEVEAFGTRACRNPRVSK